MRAPRTRREQRAATVRERFLFFQSKSTPAPSRSRLVLPICKTKPTVYKTSRAVPTISAKTSPHANEPNSHPRLVHDQLFRLVRRQAQSASRFGGGGADFQIRRAFNRLAQRRDRVLVQLAAKELRIGREAAIQADLHVVCRLLVLRLAQERRL